MAREQRTTDPVAWFEGRTLEDLKLVEYGRQMLMPDAFRRMSGNGPMFDACLIRVPRDSDLDLARIDAIVEVGRMLKSKSIQSVDAAREAIGAERFENLDTAAIVARCTHENQAPGEGQELPTQFMTLQVLRESYLPSAISDVFDHMDFLRSMLDPRFGSLTEQQFWSACGHIARAENISPLGAMRGDTQRAFVVEVCKRLSTFQTSSSSATSEPT